MGRDQALRFAIGLVEQVIAIDGRHDFDAGELAVMRLGRSQPGILVGGGRRARQERDLALAVRQLVGRQLDDRLADQVDRRRVELHVAAFRRDTGIERHDDDTALLGLLQRRNKRVGVIGRDDDRVDLLGDQGVDHLDLAFRGRLGRAGEDDAGVADFLGGFLGALAGGHEEAVADVLGDDSDAGFGKAGRSRREHQPGDQGRAEAQRFHSCHAFLLNNATGLSG